MTPILRGCAGAVHKISCRPSAVPPELLPHQPHHTAHSAIWPPAPGLSSSGASAAFLLGTARSIRSHLAAVPCLLQHPVTTKLGVSGWQWLRSASLLPSVIRHQPVTAHGLPFTSGFLQAAPPQRSNLPQTDKRAAYQEHDGGAVANFDC